MGIGLIGGTFGSGF